MGGSPNFVKIRELALDKNKIERFGPADTCSGRGGMRYSRRSLATKGFVFTFSNC